MKHQILHILKMAGISGIPRPALRTQLEVRLNRSVGDGEFADELFALLQKRLIRDREDTITGDTIYELVTPATE